MSGNDRLGEIKEKYGRNVTTSGIRQIMYGSIKYDAFQNFIYDTVIKKVLEDCYSLDRIGLDHGELSNLSKHVIVGRKITVIDFESSSTDRKVSNVTSATQALCIGSGISKIIGRVYKIPKKQKMITVLRRYKREGTRESFENLLSVLKL